MVWQHLGSLSREGSVTDHGVLIIIIITINDNVYGAVLTTTVTARVHPVHLMNAD